MLSQCTVVCFYFIVIEIELVFICLSTIPKSVFHKVIVPLAHFSIWLLLFYFLILIDNKHFTDKKHFTCYK